MRASADVLVNQAGGERVKFRRRDEQQLELTIELSLPGAGPPEHAHPLQEEHFRVLRGALALSVEGDVGVLRAGDELTIPPGARHRWSVLEADTEIAVAVRPALRFEAVLERAFALVDDGAFDESGIVDAEAVGAFIREFEGEYELVAP